MQGAAVDGGRSWTQFSKHRGDAACERYPFAFELGDSSLQRVLIASTSCYQCVTDELKVLRRHFTAKSPRRRNGLRVQTHPYVGVRSVARWNQMKCESLVRWKFANGRLNARAKAFAVERNQRNSTAGTLWQRLSECVAMNEGQS